VSEPASTIGVSVQTRATLLEQTQESRLRNIEGELFRQLDMQFDIEHPDPADRIADLGLAGTVADRFALTIGRVFPFVQRPMDLIERATTLRDLVYLINDKVGAAAIPTH
jgi:hypothetical protein